MRLGISKAPEATFDALESHREFIRYLIQYEIQGTLVSHPTSLPSFQLLLREQKTANE